mgnify:CR=1 FL=1|jgi:hypothetical protein
MGLFDKVKKTTINSRRYEEKLYEIALDEVESGEIRKGLYAKALSKSDGNKEKADGIYLKLRVQSIIDDIESDAITKKENAIAYAAIKSIEELDLSNDEGISNSHKLSEKQKEDREAIYKKFEHSGTYMNLDKAIFDESFQIATYEFDNLLVDTKIFADSKGVEISHGKEEGRLYYIEKRVKALL